MHWKPKQLGGMKTAAKKVIKNGFMGMILVKGLTIFNMVQWDDGMIV
jgi:hypothetical protein